ncbi:MAG: hypothetical protein V4650_15155 [Pseudomonadota bacterium]
MKDDTITGWLYLVYESQEPEGLYAKDGLGAFLRERGAVQYLQPFFEPLYQAHGIGVSSSDDEFIHGSAALAALREALIHAQDDCQTKPSEWHITSLGVDFYTGNSSQLPITRELLLEFLSAAVANVDRAIANGSYLVWGGGE